MCNTCNDRNHLDDDISDLFGGEGEATFEPRALVEPSVMPTPPATPEEFAQRALSNATFDPKGPATFEEPCPKCRGSGNFVGYTGRVLGQCFNCKGKGKVYRKTSAEARQKKADAAAERKQAKIKAWMEANQAEWDWMLAASVRGFNFATDMISTLSKYGDLNEFKLAKVREFMAKDAIRDAERAEQKAALLADAPDIQTESLGRIMDAFNSAIDRDVKRPKMRLDAFIFSLVREGQNAGAIYVKAIAKDDYGERRYLGKIAEGRFHRARGCTDEEQTQIVAAASDPEAAAIAYGRREGACSICGLKLTNHASIDRGIGPICASKFGWG